MKDKQIVIYGSKIIYIDRYIYESDEMFYFRINYIYNELNNTSGKGNYEEIIGMSMIESNKRFLKCLY